MSADLWRDEPHWLRRCADPRIMAVSCAWLIVLTVFGTLAQGDMGLYEAQEQYFSSWVLWFGQFPTPGGRLVLSITGLNLLSMLFTHHGTRSIGLFFLHSGMLLLLGGSLLSGAFRQDGGLSLFTGDTGNTMRSWHHDELVVRIAGAQEDREISWGEGLLSVGYQISHPELSIPFTIHQHVTNCTPMKDGTFIEKPSEKDNDRNIRGIVLRLSDSRLVAIHGFGESVALAPGLTVAVRRMEAPLPFSIELVKFERDLHPGTDMAREFSSTVLVHDGGVAREVVISMNRPLRIDDWVLYQQSFGESERGVYTVLAVVRDRFQLSPCIASSIMLIGLLMHIAVRIRPRRAGPA